MAPINITSIRIIRTNLNLVNQIGAITALDAILSGHMTVVPSDKGYGMIIKELFDYNYDTRSSNAGENKFPQYVYDTFKSLIDHKEKAMISIHSLERILDKSLLSLLAHDIVKVEDESDDELDDPMGIQDYATNVVIKDFGIDWIDSSDTKNLIKPRLFEVFTNLKEVSIHAYEYPFSLSGFLSNLQNTSIAKVRIKGNLELDKVAALSSFSPIRLYKEHQYDIKVTGIVDHGLEINKL